MDQNPFESPTAETTTCTSWPKPQATNRVMSVLALLGACVLLLVAVTVAGWLVTKGYRVAVPGVVVAYFMVAAFCTTEPFHRRLAFSLSAPIAISAGTFVVLLWHAASHADPFEQLIWEHRAVSLIGLVLSVLSVTLSVGFFVFRRIAGWLKRRRHGVTAIMYKVR